MPYYKWKNHNNGEEVEILRPIALINDPPYQDECKLPIEDAKWERLMPEGTIWAQAPGYRAGGKGAKTGFKPRVNTKPTESIR